MIKRHDQAVSDLRVATDADKLAPEAKKRIWAQMGKVWARMEEVPESTRIIEEDRYR